MPKEEIDLGVVGAGCGLFLAVVYILVVIAAVAGIAVYIWGRV